MVTQPDKSFVIPSQRFHQVLESLKRQSIFSRSQIFIGAVQPSDFELALMNQFSSEIIDATFETSDEFDR